MGFRHSSLHADDVSWICPRCASEVPDSFARCWSCGSTADGQADPNFQGMLERESFDEIEPAYEPLRLGLGTLIVMAAVTAAAFAMLKMWTPQNARHVREVVGATLLLLAAGVACRAGHSIARKCLRKGGQALADAAILLILFGMAWNVAQTMFR